MNTIKKEVSNRIRDFIWFHEESCMADTIVEPLKWYLEHKGFDKTKKEKAVLIYSLTYSVPSTIVILDKIDEFEKEPYKFWEKNKEKLIFQSDRKYVKIDNAFVRAYFDFINNGIFKEFDKFDEIDIEKAVKIVCKSYFFARFSAFLFIETYSVVFGKQVKGFKIDWKNGSTVTSGMLNVLGRDEEANLWDKKRVLVVGEDLLDKVLGELLKIASTGKNASIMETNLCAYRKLFKGSRYLGYYSDRVLEELNKTIKNFPECNDLKLLFRARKEVIPKKYLGEKNGWNGIRKEMKKHYLNTGDWRW